MIEDLFLSLRHQVAGENLSPAIVAVADRRRHRRQGAYRGSGSLVGPAVRQRGFGFARKPGTVARRCAFPCIIKPTYSTAFRQRFGVKAKRFESFDLLRDFASEVFAASIPFVVQEFIPGGEDLLVTYAAYSNDDGEVIASSTGRKIHQFPPDFGTCRLAESIDDPGLDRIGREFLCILRYRGISLTEFKRTPEAASKSSSTRGRVIGRTARPGVPRQSGAGGLQRDAQRARHAIQFRASAASGQTCRRPLLLRARIPFAGVGRNRTDLFGWLQDLRGLSATRSSIGVIRFRRGYA